MAGRPGGGSEAAVRRGSEAAVRRRQKVRIEADLSDLMIEADLSSLMIEADLSDLRRIPSPPLPSSPGSPSDRKSVV